ncbi:MAG: transposase [Nitrospirota bacterium]|nr:transposase [Nitrospirota bacterium]
MPLSIEVFPGNTQDPKTVRSQIRKLVERFGGDGLTFVGDRGMLKSRQLQEIQEHGFHYITAITKPQVEALVKQGLIQLDLFEQEVAEVEDKDGIRYILRRNPVRAEECAASRRDKLHTLERFIEKKNNYLQEHPRSHIKVATRHANELCEKLRIKEWVEIMIEGREIHLRIDEVAKTKAARLDGCYVIKTDLAVEMCSTQTVHDRYKDLTHVECAFRTSKTVELQMRPIHVCLAPRTRAHALVVMLAYRIAKELSRRWVTTNMKIQEGIDVLSMLCVNDVQTGGQTACALVPQPSAQSRELLDLAGIVLPASLPRRKIHVATRRKLHKRRKRN